MLRKTRIVLAAIFFTAITLMSLGISGIFNNLFGWMAKLQFLPAVLAVNVGIVVLILVLTIVLGRIYCSVICPMGVYQDIVSNISGHRKGKKARFTAKKNNRILRYAFLIIFLVGLVAGINVIVGVLAPYSSYGRFVRSLVGLGDAWGSNWATFAVAVAVVIIITILAWIGGRTWCNNVCPVGTVLGIFSKHSLFKIVIDKDKCKGCHICEKKCKASCIDSTTKTIDGSRCVNCFDCIDACSSKAIQYKFAGIKPKEEIHETEETKVENGRRAFIASSVALAASTVTLKAKQTKEKYERDTPLVPFGAQSGKNFHQHCTACQLCVANCPNNVLRPSSDLDRLMQPEMSYEHGYCRPECVKCSQVCPAGAIKEITPQEKTSIHIGLAKVDTSLCLQATGQSPCGKCMRHCPVGAISMVNGSPVVDESRCIGCGACEYLCPVKPLSAIKVEGYKTHVVD